MSVNIVWDDAEQTILRYDIGRQWTWDELRAGREDVFQIMDSAQSDRIYAIIHFKEHKINLPDGGLQRFREFIGYSHPKAALTIIVGANRLMKSVAGTMKSAYTRFTGRSVDFAYADSLDEARHIIADDKRRL